ncbi:hypothetical protein HPB50_028363 [Hyalomma asiaticum]|nr:hypothetical protein HPB50_028363 [Hyalomma asiaticum]
MWRQRGFSSLASVALQLAEDQAKHQRLKMWEDYEETEDTKPYEVITDRKGNYRNVVVAELKRALLLHVQSYDGNQKMEEMMNVLRLEMTGPICRWWQAGRVHHTRGSRRYVQLNTGAWITSSRMHVSGRLSHHLQATPRGQGWNRLDGSSHGVSGDYIKPGVLKKRCSQRQAADSN